MNVSTICYSFSYQKVFQQEAISFHRPGLTIGYKRFPLPFPFFILLMCILFSFFNPFLSNRFFVFVFLSFGQQISETIIDYCYLVDELIEGKSIGC